MDERIKGLCVTALAAATIMLVVRWGPIPPKECKVIEIGCKAPGFALSAVSGAITRNSDLRGRPTVLAFGSSSCPTMTSSIEGLRKLHAAYSSKIRFVVVYAREAHSKHGAMVEDESSNAESNLARRGKAAASLGRDLGFPATVLVDTPDNRTTDMYSGWPFSVFVIDRDGRIVGIERSALDTSMDSLESTLRKLSL